MFATCVLCSNRTRKKFKIFFGYASRVRKRKTENKYHYFFCFLLVNENTPHFRDLEPPRHTRSPEVFMNAWEQLQFLSRKQYCVEHIRSLSGGSSSGIILIFDDIYLRFWPRLRRLSRFEVNSVGPFQQCNVFLRKLSRPRD